MIFLLRILAAFAPAALKKREMQNLFRISASAFGCAVPSLTGLSFGQSLSEYARFTQSEAVKLSSPGGDMEGARERLFKGGRTLGERIRRICLIATSDDADSAMRILYRAIGINARFEGCAMTVSSCYFSSGYSPETCNLLSALDDGIFFDYLSFFFNRDWRFPADDTLGLMVKIADDSSGSVSDSRLEKVLTEKDIGRLNTGVEVCCSIFERLGVRRQDLIFGTKNAGHPGGMLPLTRRDPETFHNERLPENLYVADATLFPTSPGNPPILTIMAMAKRVGGICSRN
jgi:hypothetical protein